MRIWHFLLILALLPFISAADPNEFKGLVNHVSDGDTFRVQGLGDVRLADINCPELDAKGGPEAKDYARSLLLNKIVYLDIDDKSEKDKYGRYVCVAYLARPDGFLDSSRNVNRILVDEGYTQMCNMKDNEFEPGKWWESSSENGQEPGKKYVGSIKSDKYHYPECRWAKEINPDNEVWFVDALDARNRGYKPCGVCHPPRLLFFRSPGS